MILTSSSLLNPRSAVEKLFASPIQVISSSIKHIETLSLVISDSPVAFDFTNDSDGRGRLAFSVLSGTFLPLVPSSECRSDSHIYLMSLRKDEGDKGTISRLTLPQCTIKSFAFYKDTDLLALHSNEEGDPSHPP